MVKNNLNIKEIISEGWVKTKNNFWFLFCLFIASAFIMYLTNHSDLLSFLISIPVGIATLTIAIVVASGHHPKYSDIFKSFDSYKITLNYFITSILYLVIVSLGLLVLILPGIYLAIRLQFYKFLVIENENMNPLEIIKESYKMTENHFWNLFGFIFVVIIMNLIGAIPFGLGLIVTIPLTVISSAILYKKLLPHRHQVHAE